MIRPDSLWTVDGVVVLVLASYKGGGDISWLPLLAIGHLQVPTNLMMYSHLAAILINAICFYTALELDEVTALCPYQLAPCFSHFPVKTESECVIL